MSQQAVSDVIKDCESSVAKLRAMGGCYAITGNALAILAEEIKQANLA